MFDQAISPKESSSLNSNLDPHESFFKHVSKDGYPQRDLTAAPRVQPWKRVWSGPQVSEDGRLLIACPRRIDYGTNNIGGY